jgi:hypothetical protein
MQTPGDAQETARDVIAKACGSQNSESERYLRNVQAEDIIAALDQAGFRIVGTVKREPDIATISDIELSRQWDEAEQWRDWSTCNAIWGEWQRRAALARAEKEK